MSRKKAEAPKVSETKKKPVTRKKPTPKPKEFEYVIVDREKEFPYDIFPWKLVYKEGAEKRTCYFECEEHRTKHITRYKLNKKNILFIGYKYD